MTYKIAIIGLGYVGLPLSLAYGRKYFTVGFDTDTKRTKDLEKGFDKTKEITSAEIKKAKYLSFTSDKKEIQKANTYIITVPTPVDKNKKPNLNI